ncbi:hypothetical protein EXIGLDRAFT_691542 [Exidia glandulosa HHB12029]|uniref:Uncharacterized protein n=1 Tax=Exidia glandulosa HHB12029 TaxID=1314781 RepID=A0A165Z0I1_EXIGL|nr:hypothetical protein EXIGLDRAFT_691542 [Exidia glandulosa HHB12029]
MFLIDTNGEQTSRRLMRHQIDDLYASGTTEQRGITFSRQIPSYKTKRLSPTHYILLVPHAHPMYHRPYAENTPTRPRGEQNTFTPWTFAPPHHPLSNTRTSTRIRTTPLGPGDTAYNSMSTATGFDHKPSSRRDQPSTSVVLKSTIDGSSACSEREQINIREWLAEIKCKQFAEANYDGIREWRKYSNQDKSKEPLPAGRGRFYIQKGSHNSHAQTHKLDVRKLDVCGNALTLSESSREPAKSDVSTNPYRRVAHGHFGVKYHDLASLAAVCVQIPEAVKRCVWTGLSVGGKFDFPTVCQAKLFAGRASYEVVQIETQHIQDSFQGAARRQADCHCRRYGSRCGDYHLSPVIRQTPVMAAREKEHVTCVTVTSAQHSICARERTQSIEE